MTAAFATRDELRILDALAGAHRGQGPVGVGFSGGGDSLALLAIASEWARARAVPLIALHVDHGLRAESGAEAARAQSAAARLGVPCRVLSWTGPKPDRGVEATARAARHALLARACAEAGAPVLLLAHTIDDQAETVMMRLARPAPTARGLAGLAPLAPSPAWPGGAGLALARPLLGTRRDDLRARLAAAGRSWIEDPSNSDLAHERVRARVRLAGLGRETTARLARIAGTAARAEAARRAAALRALRAVRPLPLGAFALDRERFALASSPARRLALEAVLGAASGRPGPIESARLDRLLELLEPSAEFRGATLAGAAMSSLSGGGRAAVVARDPGALAGRGGTRVGLEDGVWDGRFRLAAPLAQDEEIVPARGRRARLPVTEQKLLMQAPAAARGAAAVAAAPGRPPRLARGTFISPQALARRVLPDRPEAWSDVMAACAALGFGYVAHHMEVSLTAAEPAAEALQHRDGAAGMTNG